MRSVDAAKGPVDMHRPNVSTGWVACSLLNCVFPIILHELSRLQWAFLHTLCAIRLFSLPLVYELQKVHEIHQDQITIILSRKLEKSQTPPKALIHKARNTVHNLIDVNTSLT